MRVMSVGKQIIINLRAKNYDLTEDERALAAAFDKEITWRMAVFAAIAMFGTIGSGIIMHICDKQAEFLQHISALQQTVDLADLGNSTTAQGAPAIYDFDPHPCSAPFSEEGPLSASKIMDG